MSLLIFARLGEGLCGYLSAQVSLTQSAGMLGLRVRGRGGRDRTAPVAAPISAFLWASTKEMGSKGRTGQRPPPNVSAHTYQANKEKGEPPARVPPWTPSCAYESKKGVPPAAAGGQRRCLWTPPAFLKKSGAKNFKLTVNSGSRGAFWSGWGGGACGAPWPRSGGCAHG